MTECQRCRGFSFSFSFSSGSSRSRSFSIFWASSCAMFSIFISVYSSHSCFLHSALAMSDGRD